MKTLTEIWTERKQPRKRHHCFALHVGDGAKAIVFQSACTGSWSNCGSFEDFMERFQAGKYRGGVERACTEKGRPSYCWHDGYSANNEAGHMLAPWQTVRECQAEARRDGVRAEYRNEKHGLPLEPVAAEANALPEMLAPGWDAK